MEWLHRVVCLGISPLGRAEAQKRRGSVEVRSISPKKWSVGLYIPSEAVSQSEAAMAQQSPIRDQGASSQNGRANREA